MRFALALCFFAFLGCSSSAKKESLSDQPAAGAAPETREQYFKTVKRHTVSSNQYAGFYQTFQADVTILSSEMQTAALGQRKAFMQWDEKAYLAEREKMMQENSAYAKFFLRFYVPDHEYDDLHKGKTIWKVYLDFSGQRFEGKVKKMTDKMVDISTLYPHHDRFSTPYEVTFSVPMARVEAGQSKFVLTSSLGTAEFSFPVSK